MSRSHRRRRRPPTRVERGVALLLAVVAVLSIVALVGDGRDDEQAQPQQASASTPIGPRLVQLRGADGCLKGSGSPRWTPCRVRSGRLKDARALAVSPDGRFAYATSVEASSVVAFARDTRTGSLRPLGGRSGCLVDPGAPRTSGCGRVRGLRGALTITLSRDGRHAYVAAIDADTVVAFVRNRQTGVLRRVRGTTGCVSDEGTGVTGCGTAPGLAGARWVSVSPDGRTAYVASPASDAIAVLRRNRTTGGLQPVRGADCVRDERSRTACPTSITGLDEPRMVTVSPDGRNVYAVGEHSYTVVALQRDVRTGALKPVADAPCVEDVRAPDPVTCPAATPGLNFAFFVTVSPDGRHVYTAATASDAVAAFERDPSTGALRPLAAGGGCVADVHAPEPGCPRRARGLDGAASVRLSRDGRFAYVASFYGGSVAVLRRDRETGALESLGGKSACLSDPAAPSTPKTTRCPTPARGLEGPRDVVLSPDGRNAYVPASVGGSIASFSRQR